MRGVVAEPERRQGMEIFVQADGKNNHEDPGKKEERIAEQICNKQIGT